MGKKEEFKTFAKTHPELINSIKSGDATWQKLYEIYDIYGEEESAWDTYFNRNNTSNDTSFSSITNTLKNIDMDSVQKHIQTAQKALDLVSEITGKSSTPNITKGPTTPRPINKFFED